MIMRHLSLLLLLFFSYAACLHGLHNNDIATQSIDSESHMRTSDQDKKENSLRSSIKTKDEERLSFPFFWKGPRSTATTEISAEAARAATTEFSAVATREATNAEKEIIDGAKVVDVKKVGRLRHILNQIKKIPVKGDVLYMLIIYGILFVSTILIILAGVAINHHVQSQLLDLFLSNLFVMSDNALCLGDYEAKRLRRIETNQRMLQSLNLERFSHCVKRTRELKMTKSIEPVRRSRRVQTLRLAQVKASYTTSRLRGNSRPRVVHDKRRLKEKQNSKQWDLEQEQEFQRALKTYPPQLQLPFVYPCQLRKTCQATMMQTLSSTSIEIELDMFHSRCLGIQILPMGKQSVIQALCPSGITTRVSYNNHVIVWKNALTLFGSEDCTLQYNKLITNGPNDVVFDWKVCSDISPAIQQRLHQVERGRRDLKLDDSYDTSEEICTTPVLLFLQHATGPYIYCGRIQYLGYKMQATTFRWQLMDIASMDWKALYSILCQSEQSNKPDV
ncbi:RxLR-like protein [Plasmopara halstedii]|uniref:RxLR-like protein n=1 Tax=Plasmopara halstedii TaxID=4781 RepID=A0A0P1A7N4_PLAHL|nr:RxLR-like protein [Plasmopara halstedii]CEG36280.1 RxLR-like protein [Plasmopara halstedii]|eukprot:XP_024572649.1 RxLR-like protein [Plasmopara halstedii]